MFSVSVMLSPLVAVPWIGVLGSLDATSIIKREYCESLFPNYGRNPRAV